jgi:hypothetical protein
MPMMCTWWVRRSSRAPVCVGRQDQAHLLVALAEEAKQMLRTVAVQWDVAQFVDDDQVRGVLLLDLFFQLQDLPFLAGFRVEVGQT